MYDLVIRGGTIIDGTGSSRYVGDVAVEGQVIAAVGDVDGPGRREIDAGGLIVSPGFVDVHTHYDGQAMWDPQLSPSSWHGVTTVVFGNCGVGFAPVRPGAAEALIELMEGVEDIPGSVLAEGVGFEWESFPEYLDALERLPHAIDLGAQLPHSALRLYVMGARGADHLEAPSADEISAMAQLAAEAVHAGALGFSTSRTRNHRTMAGRSIPTLTAPFQELIGIAEGLSSAQKGALQVITDAFLGSEDTGPDEEFAQLRALAEHSGRPLSVTLIQGNRNVRSWRRVLDLMSDAARDGVEITAQVAARAPGTMCGLETTSNPFATHPSFLQVAALPLEELVRELRRPERRTAILNEEPLGDARGYAQRLFGAMDLLFELGDPPNYEPDASMSVAARAAGMGMTAAELAYDLLLEHDGRNLLYRPLGNFADGTLDVVQDMLRHERAVPGLSDGGAHAGTLCDASFPTFLLSYWGRDRRRGQLLGLESLVAGQARRTAELVGLQDRGVLKPGYKADINVFDYEALGCRAPVVVRDLPAGGRRLVQQATGYKHTFCSGVETFTDGVPTGELPGVLVRGGQRPRA